MVRAEQFCSKVVAERRSLFWNRRDTSGLPGYRFGGGVANISPDHVGPCRTVPDVSYKTFLIDCELDLQSINTDF
jgi:hypothetical protein